MNALVVGSGCTVWDDLRGVPDLWWECVVVVNDIGCYLPGHIDHWATLHPEKFEAWELLRRHHGGNGDYAKWTRVPPYGIDREIHGATQIRHPGGSSGLLAVEVARHVGAKRIVLCGVPMDPVPHFCRGEPWEEAVSFRKDWESWQPNLGSVRSMSGWTANLLGTPNWAEWPVPRKHLEALGLTASAPSS